MANPPDLQLSNPRTYIFRKNGPNLFDFDYDIASHLKNRSVTQDDLSELVEFLHPVRSKWYGMGLRLGVPVSDLNSIRSQFYDPVVCLCEMLQLWLKRQGTKWSDVFGALSSRSVGEEQLGLQLLQEKFGPIERIDCIESHKSGFRSYDITVVGKVGSGKSALVNNIMGEKVAEERASAFNGPSTMTKHSMKIGDYDVTWYDTPGFRQRVYTSSDEEVIEEISEPVTSDSNVLTLCVPMNQQQPSTDDVQTIRMVTEKFGTNVWKNGVIALTFANEVKPGEFKKKLSDWTIILRNVLKREVKVPARIANSVPVIPVGYTDPLLHDCEDWKAQFKSTVAQRTELGAI